MLFVLLCIAYYIIDLYLYLYMYLYMYNLMYIYFVYTAVLYGLELNLIVVHLFGLSTLHLFL